MENLDSYLLKAMFENNKKITEINCRHRAVIASFKNMQLTDKDIKTIKYEKRIGFVFSGFVLAFGGLFNLIYVVTHQDFNWAMLILIDSGLIGLSVLISYLINRKYNLDLKAGTKVVRIEKVQQIENKTTYEAGSGSMYIPILGDLFPKLWKQEMRPIVKLNLIINGFRFEVEKDTFFNVKKDDLVEMYYSKHSDTLLGIAIKKD